MNEIQQVRKQKAQEINQYANERGFAINMTMMGPVIVPIKDGKPMGQDEIQSLSQEERSELSGKESEINEKLKELQKEMRGLQKDQQKQEREFDRQVVLNTVGGAMENLRDKYSKYDNISDYFEDVQNDILENIRIFKANQQQMQGQGQNIQAEQIKQRLMMMRDVKIILVGTPILYNLLQARVPEFSELFKVKADFDTTMDKTDRNIPTSFSRTR